MSTAPADTDVFFVGHAGLEAFMTGGDIWRGMPMDTTVAVRTWHYPAEAIPPAGANRRPGSTTSGRRSTPGSARKLASDRSPAQGTQGAVFGSMNGIICPQLLAHLLDLMRLVQRPLLVEEGGPLPGLGHPLVGEGT